MLIINLLQIIWIMSLFFKFYSFNQLAIKMSDVFDSCQSNFLKSIRFVQKKLTENGEGIITQMNEAISEATQELNKMEIEYGMCQQSDMKAKINLYKDELRSYKKKVSEKDKVIKQDRQLHQLSDQIFEKEEEVGANPLLEAKRQMYQNQAISHQAMLGIKKNNQKLKKNIERMGDIDSNLTVAQQLLGSIKRKMSKNKYMLYATIFALLLVVVFVIYTYVK